MSTVNFWINESGVNFWGDTPEVINERARAKFAAGALVKVAFIGDSVMRNESVNNINTTPHYGTVGRFFPGYLCGATGQMYMVKSGQTPTENLYQIFTTQMDTVLDYGDAKPDVLFFAPSLNDIDTSPGDGSDYTVWGNDATERATVRSWMEGVYDKAHAHGIAVIYIDGWPSDTLASSTNQKTNMQAMYDIGRDVARKKGALMTLSILGSGKYSDEDGGWKSGYNPSGDGVHLTQFDSLAMAYDCYEQMQAQMPMKPYYPLPLIDDSDGAAILAHMRPTAASAPSGWNQNDSALTWASPVNDEYGSDAWCSITATSDSETIFTHTIPTATAGDKILVCIDARSNKANGDANTPYINFRVIGQSNTMDINLVWGNNQFGATGRGWLFRHIFELDTNNPDFWLYIKNGAFTANFQWRCKVINLTQLGIDPYSS